MSTFVFNMSTKSLDSTSAALFGKTRRGVLGLLYGRPDERFYLRQIARSAGASAGTARRELEQLVAAGLLLREPDGNQVYYRADNRSPIFADLRNIIAKTAGIGDLLRSALAPLRTRIRVAFIFGSVAEGGQRSGSDVDLMAIGDISLGEVVTATIPVQSAIGREVNPTVYSAEEWRSRVVKGQHFVRMVSARPKIFLVGDSDELDRLAQ
jgi:predicted nucleotidyltransferase